MEMARSSSLDRVRTDVAQGGGGRLLPMGRPGPDDHPDPSAEPVPSGNPGFFKGDSPLRFAFFWSGSGSIVDIRAPESYRYRRLTGVRIVMIRTHPALAGPSEKYLM